MLGLPAETTSKSLTGNLNFFRVFDCSCMKYNYPSSMNRGCKTWHRFTTCEKCKNICKKTSQKKRERQQAPSKCRNTHPPHGVELNRPPTVSNAMQETSWHCTAWNSRYKPSSFNLRTTIKLPIPCLLLRNIHQRPRDVI